MSAAIRIYVDGLEEHPAEGYRGKDAAQAKRVGGRNGHQWCHLLADRSDCDELHVFAQRIGLKRQWFDPRDGVGGHYDLTPGRRAAAIAAGAIELDRNGLVELLRKHREQAGVAR